MKYICQICGYVYDEDTEGIAFRDLPDDWTCPICKAPKSRFAPAEAETLLESDTTDDEYDEELTEFPTGVLAAIFSNLARGAEKQYRDSDAKHLRAIADYFTSRVSDIPAPGISLLKEISSKNSNSYFPEIRKAAVASSDRGALRACTWSEKVELIISALLEKYETEGEKGLENTKIWVCSICGFVYIGDNPPEICPVCKVPEWKFNEIRG